MKILFGITSSIAAYRIPNLISRLRKDGHEIKVIVTEAAKAFVAPQALAVMSQNPCFSDSDEWGPTERVWHIDLAKWCDVMIIAPLTANTLARMAHGFCDNLLTAVVRALGEKPLIVAPAMNNRMWNNPITAEQLSRLKNYYRITVIDPIEKVLADGDEGMGGLAEDDTIVNVISEFKS